MFAFVAALTVSTLPATPIDADTAGATVTVSESNFFASSALLNVIVKPDPGRQPSPYPHCVSVMASAEYVVAECVDALVVVRGPSADGVPGPIEIASAAPLGRGRVGRNATHRPSCASLEIWCTSSLAITSAVVARRIAVFVPFTAQRVVFSTAAGSTRWSKVAMNTGVVSTVVVLGANVSTFGGGVRNVQ